MCSLCAAVGIVPPRTRSPTDEAQNVDGVFRRHRKASNGISRVNAATHPDRRRGGHTQLNALEGNVFLNGYKKTKKHLDPGPSVFPGATEERRVPHGDEVQDECGGADRAAPSEPEQLCEGQEAQPEPGRAARRKLQGGGSTCYLDRTVL